MIEFKQVNKYFSKNGHSVKVLDDINLTINDGDIFGIIGYSGAGKSTLIRLINRLEKPTTGAVLVNGQDLASYSDNDIRRVKRKISMIFQGFNLLETKTVAENIGLPLLLTGVSKKERNQVIDKLLTFVELSDKKHAYPNELSGGQKQRVSIARALVNNPDILLCDEATSALDPETTRSILNLLKKINQEQNVTIILVTHEMSVVKHICNNVLVMEQGKIIEQGNILDVFQKPVSKVTRKFINSVLSDMLPSNIVDSLKNENIQHIFRLEFLADSSKKAVINEAILRGKGEVRINILFSNMIDIKDSVVGYMFANIEGEPSIVKSTIDFLTSQDVCVAQLNKDNGYDYL